MADAVTTIHIRPATLTDLAPLAQLFNDYLLFYGREANLAGATTFLRARLTAQESIVFVAEAGDELAGFVQLYPTWSSLALARFYVLYDLYVAPEHRRVGIAGQLITTATEFAREQGACGLSLQTHVDNHNAQSLYESLGWMREVEFYSYFKDLS